MFDCDSRYAIENRLTDRQGLRKQTVTQSSGGLMIVDSGILLAPVAGKNTADGTRMELFRKEPDLMSRVGFGKNSWPELTVQP